MTRLLLNQRSHRVCVCVLLLLYLCVPRAVLCDFETSKNIGSSAVTSIFTVTQRVVFTGESREHEAPELLQPGATNTMETDVFSLGVVLHEVLAGERPELVHDYSVRNEVRKQLRLHPSVPAAVVPVLKAALAGDPRERPRAMDIASCDYLRGALLSSGEQQRGNGGQSEGGESESALQTAADQVSQLARQLRQQHPRGEQLRVRVQRVRNQQGELGLDLDTSLAVVTQWEDTSGLLRSSLTTCFVLAATE